MRKPIDEELLLALARRLPCFPTLDPISDIDEFEELAGLDRMRQALKIELADWARLSFIPLEYLNFYLEGKVRPQQRTMIKLWKGFFRVLKRPTGGTREVDE